MKAEEELSLGAVQRLDVRDLLVLIVPRHPQRFGAAAALIEHAGGPISGAARASRSRRRRASCWATAWARCSRTLRGGQRGVIGGSRRRKTRQSPPKRWRRATPYRRAAHNVCLVGPALPRGGCARRHSMRRRRSATPPITARSGARATDGRRGRCFYARAPRRRAKNRRSLEVLSASGGASRSAAIAIKRMLRDHHVHAVIVGIERNRVANLQRESWRRPAGAGLRSGESGDRSSLRQPSRSHCGVNATPGSKTKSMRARSAGGHAARGSRMPHVPVCTLFGILNVMQFEAASVAVDARQAQIACRTRARSSL